MTTDRKSLASLKGLPRTLTAFDYAQNRPIYATEKPYEVMGALSPENEIFRTNIIFARHATPVYDLRNELGSLSLDQNGVEIVDYPEPHRYRFDTEETVKGYLNSLVSVLGQRFRAESVIVYSYNYRKAGRTDGSVQGGEFLPRDAPIRDVHSDATKEGGLRRIHRCLNEQERKKYLDGTWRLRIINAWRPVSSVVVDCPLAFCDPSSVDSSDLLATDRPGSDYAGEIYYLKYNPKQRFYWVSEQRPDEMMLFTSYDSAAESISTPGNAFVPHASFLNPNAPIDAPKRESIEVRVVVIAKE